MVLVLAALLVIPVAGQAVDMPRLSGPVVDLAGLLDQGTRVKMEAALRRYRQASGNQLQTLIVPALEGVPIEEYSIRVVEKWKLGVEGKDNGVLLLIAVEDHKWRIEVGGGLEGELTDVQAFRIGRNELAPRFREGRHAEGVANTLQAIAHALGGELDFGAIVTPSRGRRSTRGWGSIVLFFFALLFMFGGRGRGRGLFAGLLLGSMLGGGLGGRGGWSGGGGSIGGGWSGGGGGFSGGGASGGW